jgi:hypothetical protein
METGVQGLAVEERQAAAVEIFVGRVNTAGPGVEGTPTPVVARACRTWKPRQRPGRRQALTVSRRQRWPNSLAGTGCPRSECRCAVRRRETGTCGWHPGVTTRPGMSSITGHQQGFTGVHPPQPSPHLWPPDGTAALGLSPGLRTPPGKTRQRTPGRGRASVLPEVTSSASLTSSDALTHHERHHVAHPLEVGLGAFPCRCGR